MAIVRSKISAYADLPYDEQMEKKEESLKLIMKNVKDIGRKNCRHGDYVCLTWLENEENPLMCP